MFLSFSKFLGNYVVTPVPLNIAIVFHVPEESLFCLMIDRVTVLKLMYRENALRQCFKRNMVFLSEDSDCCFGPKATILSPTYSTLPFI